MDTSELKIYLKTALQQMIDNAGSFNGENGFTVILDNSNTEQEQYQDAPLFSGQTLAIKPPCDDMRGLQNAKQHVPEQIRRMKNSVIIPSQRKKQHRIELQTAQHQERKSMFRSKSAE